MSIRIVGVRETAEGVYPKPSSWGHSQELIDPQHLHLTITQHMHMEH